MKPFRHFSWGMMLAAFFSVVLGAASIHAGEEPPPVLAPAPDAAPLAVGLPPAPTAAPLAAPALSGSPEALPLAAPALANAPEAAALPALAIESSSPAAPLEVAAELSAAAAPLAVNAAGSTHADPLLVSATVANPSLFLRVEAAENESPAWAPILARLAALPFNPPNRALTREEENLFQLRGYIRARGTNPETLAFARRVLKTL